ncbi:olfactory receptor 4F15 [Clostridium sp. HV4-5-A1G]|nr:olfactory receptor 4F15 [Clostridium sp. HV4-5-A1G]
MLFFDSIQFYHKSVRSYFILQQEIYRIYADYSVSQTPIFSLTKKGGDIL